MKFSRPQTRRKYKKIPSLQFETESPMTACAGLVLFQALFGRLDLKRRLVRCFSHLDGDAIYRHGLVLLQLVVQVLLGHRHLRARDLIAGDPMVLRLLGVTRLADVATISRMLSGADAQSVGAVRRVSRELVLERASSEKLRVVTLDFDGTVQSTTGHAEGTAVGFNKKKKGARSYYPLLCTVAQTGQVLDLHHRPGNVHDSNGALDFMRNCFRTAGEYLPKARYEARFDAAFFDQAILTELDALGVQFSGSVPFQRFPALKAQIHAADEWRRINDTWQYASTDWKPKSWPASFRFILFRRRSAVQRKGALQLDLFEPRDFTWEYKAVVTSKLAEHPRTVLAFHNGRGSQEKLIGEVKQHAAFGAIPTRTLCGNQLFSLSGVLAHNLCRELQMQCVPRTRGTLPKRPARWSFESLGTLRRRLILRVGRLVRPQNRLTLRIAGDDTVRQQMQGYMKALQKAA